MTTNHDETLHVDPQDGQTWKTGSIVLIEGEQYLITKVKCREFPFLEYDLRKFDAMKRSQQWTWHAEDREYFLDTIIPKHSVGAELGVYCGDLTQHILDIVQPEKLHLVDMWHLFGEDAYQQWGITGPSTSEALTMVQLGYADQIAAGQVAIHVADDLQWLPTVDDDYFDWCYIDTCHTYEHCSAELPLVAAKVRPGGVIAGDDWSGDPNHPHHGVWVAVHEYLEQHPDYKLIYDADKEDGQWAIARS